MIKIPAGEWTGSSPRIRGECQVKVLDDVRLGIIPANTGRINRYDHDCKEPQDHPREYGENKVSCRAAPLVEGSSPRIRGEYAEK